MRRILLKIAYDGTNYVGWQVQPNGIAIEEVLNQSLSRLLKEEIMVIGASRTDSGVHADGNLCVFDTNSRIPAEKFKFAINEFLPDDIVVVESKEVPFTYHPRKINSVKTYEYRILNRKIPDPKERNFSHFFYYDLDVEKMNRAAQCLVGEHDFKSFCSLRTDVEDTIREIRHISVTKAGDIITLRVSGTGFLYNMVRIIAGTLIKIGTGIFTEDSMKEILEKRDRSAAGPKAPANGLTLISIMEEETLPEIQQAKNEHWSTTCYQEWIYQNKIALLVIHQAEERDYHRILLKNTKQLSRNGAEKIYVLDWTDRLFAGQQEDYFTYEKPALEDIPSGIQELLTEEINRVFVTSDKKKRSQAEEGTEE